MWQARDDWIAYASSFDVTHFALAKWIGAVFAGFFVAGSSIVLSLIYLYVVV